MIQDITPHQYDNHYIEYQPQITDFCICIKDGTALLCQDKKEKNSFAGKQGCSFFMQCR